MRADAIMKGCDAVTKWVVTACVESVMPSPAAENIILRDVGV
ncbi:hypothetical protein Tco_0066515, partial [Tanacetum coccineum]